MFDLDSEKGVILAPMAGISDVPFRTLCKEHGADMTFTEMVSAKGLHYANDKTRCLLDMAENEESIGVQLFGHEPEVMGEQAQAIQEDLGDSLFCIDVNMGCPVRKVVSKGEGAALMLDPELAARIVRAIKDAIDAKVTVKFRRGFELGEDTSLEFALAMEDAGADGITIHGRFARQFYRGHSDRGCIAKIKEMVQIPVIGNGDIFTVEDALDVFEETGCDHIMVARGAEGNPWIFEGIKRALEGNGKPFVPTYEERIECAREHARLIDNDKDSKMVKMRKHAAFYIKGMPGASKMRGLFNSCSTLEDFISLFDSYLDAISDDQPSSSKIAF